jgi:hypothetical protein
VQVDVDKAEKTRADHPFRVGEEFVLHAELLSRYRDAGTEDQVTEVLGAAVHTAAAAGRDQQNENQDNTENTLNDHSRRHRFTDNPIG